MFSKVNAERCFFKRLAGFFIINIMSEKNILKVENYTARLNMNGGNDNIFKVNFVKFFTFTIFDGWNFEMRNKNLLTGLNIRIRYTFIAAFFDC